MRSRLLVVPALSILIAACQQHTPTAVPTALSASPSPQSLSQVEILETQHVWDQATARAQRITPTAPAAVSPSTPAPTAEPDLIYTADDLLPSPYTGTLPDGAVAVLGLGSVSASPSPDGRYFAVSSIEGVMVYDFNTLQPLWDAPKPSGGITWLSDGKRVQIGRTIWDIESGASLWESTVSRNLSPDGEIIAQDNGDNTVSLFDRETGKTISVLKLPTDLDLPDSHFDVWMFFSPDSKRVATQYANYGSDLVSDLPFLAVWDIQTGALLQVFQGVEPDIQRRVRWSPDSSMIAAQSSFGESGVWDVTTGERLMDFPNGFVQWSPDGSYVTQSDARVILHRSGQMAGELPLEDLHEAAWSADSSTLVVSSYSEGISTITLWNLATQTRLHTIYRAVCDPCAISADKTHLIAIPQDKSVILIWDLQNNSSTPVMHIGATDSINDLVWSPEGHQILSDEGWYAGQVVMWDVQATQPTELLANDTNLFDTQAPGGGVDWSSTGWLVFGGSRYATWWNHANHKSGWRFPTGLDLGLAPNSAKAATTYYNFDNDKSFLEIYSPDVEKTLLQIAQSDTVLVQLDWSPDGQQLAVAALPRKGVRIFGSADESFTSEILIFNPTTSDIEIRLNGIDSAIYSVAWSPDGTKIAAGFEDDVIGVWDIASGRLVYKLSGGVPFDQENAYVDIDWSPDSKLLAAAYGKTYFYRDCNGCGGTGPGAAVVWDVERGERLYRFDWQQIEVQAVAFSPDGSLLASGGRNGTIVLWDMTHK